MRRSRVLGSAVVVMLLGGSAAVVPARAVDDAPVCEEVLVRADDGVDLYASIYRPSAQGVFPVAWTMTPYGEAPCGPSPQGPEFARVTVHIRGTGASEGALDGYARRDQQDFAKVVPDWIARQAWSNGRILAVGASATAYWIPWALTHPNVSAGLQQMSCVDGYRGCLRPGGGMVGGTVILTQGVLAGSVQNYPTRVRMGQDLVSAEQLQASGDALTEQWLRDTYDEFWQERSALPFIGSLRAPVMYTLDLYDYVPWSLYEGYLNTSGARLNTGIGHNSFMMRRKGDLPELIGGPADRFVRHQLLGEQSRGDERVTVVTNLGSLAGYQEGRVVVRGEKDWPLPGTEWTRLLLAPGRTGSAVSLNDGALQLGGIAPATTAPAPVSSVVGPRSELRALLNGALRANSQAGQEVVSYSSIGNMGSDESGALTFSTAPLGGDVELTGPVTLRLWATATSPNLEWAVRLTDVWPDGRSEWITDGQLRASLRRVDEAKSLKKKGEIVFPFHTYAAHEPVPVGQPVEYLITLAPTSNVFAAGHRIRLDILPVAAQSFDGVRTGGLGGVLVHQGGAHASSVLLPIVPKRCHLGQPGLPGMPTPGPCVGLDAALS